ncbi:ferredoxin [Sinanaerobacter sp. ZZT-01]|uniref:ferredoxin n=1 Tax=Sinanaerobacter sp. ZZT-01 TaxID=3111540 RepID=UPI002D77CF14|nr:ferredoxin [Sinanaerobacter sp. ZZT-01]WRR92386.1 ferredoxin [Sinanaerobacter sp. ZZT-01]
MKAKVNEGCIGCGLCEGICPDVFRMGADGVAEVYGEVTPDQEERAIEAKESCPVTVIDVK